MLASPQTSFGEKWMRDERTPKDVCGKATAELAWENSRHLATQPLVSPPNVIWRGTIGSVANCRLFSQATAMPM